MHNRPDQTALWNPDPAPPPPAPPAAGLREAARRWAVTASLCCLTAGLSAGAEAYAAWGHYASGLAFVAWAVAGAGCWILSGE